ncbi:MFS general substrate transporter [Lindgomyces ingoldianus]|uniref:MFS general substrate transporter n=1 Tax=Lindgomyces ingoldianus TaxID=673940 RepID=A0ACB6R739_9PLEO|nr:MFS general substrate transporter [Lindgomyces ingoldianus]KAF2475006.1 MFS general substrate transporter [Lindgomyces ingoldianus]
MDKKPSPIEYHEHKPLSAIEKDHGAVYLLNFLDRGNIGNSKVLNAETRDDLLQQTHMTSNNYALTVTLFSLAYTLFEVPSNWVMKHYVRPSMWLGFLLFCWGVLTMGFAGVKSYASVVVLRFFIGVFEAGFFPGDAFLLWFCLPDYPARATWLNSSDKHFAVSRLESRGGGYNRAHASHEEIFQTLFSPRMLAHYLAYIADVVPQGSFTFFTPTIVTGLGYTSIHAQLLTVPPWVVGFCVAITLSYSADHFDARGWHITTASLVGGIGWLTAGLLPPDAYGKRYGCLCLAAAGAFPAAPAMTNWVTCNTPSFLTIPLAIALHNSSAGIGQIIAQWIWKAGEAKDGYPTGNFVCAGCSFFVAVVAAGLRITYGVMNRREVRDASGEKRVWAY